MVGDTPAPSQQVLVTGCTTRLKVTLAMKNGATGILDARARLVRRRRHVSVLYPKR